jgi:hypothetical protein
MFPWRSRVLRLDDKRYETAIYKSALKRAKKQVLFLKNKIKKFIIWKNQF